MTGSLPPEQARSANSLDTIDLGISEALNRAAQAVVRSKYILDTAATQFRPAILERDLYDGGYGPTNPLCFLQRIIPFAYTLERSHDKVFARVPTENTIGCSWRWRRSSLDDAEREKCREKVDNEEDLHSGRIDDASYIWVKPLGLIAPHEGKNRVDFFRGEGIDSIPAKVSEWGYVEPSRITLYSVKDHAFEATWAVLDDRWVELVPHPGWTLPLMAAYGAKTEKPWPATFPTPADVLLALFDSPRGNSPLGDPDHKNATVIDLDTIKAIDDFQSERVRVTVHDLKDVKIDHRLWQCALAGVLVALALLALLPERWSDARILSGVLLGAAGCIGMVPYLFRCITVSRRGLSRVEFLPIDRCPKKAGRKFRRELG